MHRTTTSYHRKYLLPTSAGHNDTANDVNTGSSQLPPQTRKAFPYLHHCR